MPCPHGCQPDDGLLDDVTGLQLLAGNLHAGGDNGQLGDGPLPTPEMTAQACTPRACAPRCAACCTDRTRRRAAPLRGRGLPGRILPA